MIYNNLLFFLIAIFLFTMTSGTTAPEHSLPVSLCFFVSLFLLYDYCCKLLFSKYKKRGSIHYFDIEKRLTLLALFFYGALLYLCDLHYYLKPLSCNEQFPALVNITGLLFFFLFLSVMWHRAKPIYETIFSQKRSSSAFLLTNIKTNLPIVLPWIVLSLSYDLLALLPFPQLAVFLHSETGEYVSFLLFLLAILILFPPIVRRLWNCTPLPEGPLHDHLQDFFKKQNFSARIFLWPLFEGRVITAGVMGIVPGLRYVMITPALLEHLNLEELDAVMAHEIGHIRKKHILLYLLIISGFSILAGFILEPFSVFILSRDWYYTTLQLTGISSENLLAAITAVAALLTLIVYFRFLFGYFIRNFERQADLHVFEAIGNCNSIISSFEKIAILSGNIRDLPSWHHFGIGQRIDFLRLCESDPAMINKHNRKVRSSLLAYIILVVLAASSQNLLPLETWKIQYEEKYTDYIINQTFSKETDRRLWLGLADELLQHKKMEKKAVLAYNKALELEPDNPRLLNNLAWLLLTCDDVTLRDPKRALDMARLASMQLPTGGILDTLAMAYWANGFMTKAVETEKQAIFVDPTEGDYYQRQINRFKNSQYSNDSQDPGTEKENV